VRQLLLITFLSLPLLADDRAKEILSASHTDRFTATGAGTIRVENSFGEVDIDGWDRPDVEVTVVRSTEHVYDSKQRAEAQRRLDSVQVTARQDGNDTVVSTAYPARNTFLHPLSRRSDIEISYLIKAPRTSKVTVVDNRGGVNIFDIGGDIHATVINGQITLTLAPSRRYAIDAESKLGSVYSDFEGHDRSRRLLGEDFGSTGAAAATSLYLRVRVGDIIIQKLHGPPNTD
jgi:hypothetical protein